MIAVLEAPAAAPSSLARVGQAIDAALAACGHPQPPGPWPTPTPDQIAEARRMQVDPPNRRTN